MRKTLRNIGGWILAGFTFLGFLLIYAGLGGRGRFSSYVGETNWHIVVLGIVLIIPFVIFMVRLVLLRNKLINLDKTRVNSLIKSGDKITINLEKLKIQSRQYKKERKTYNQYGDNVVYIDTYDNLIEIGIPYKNEIIKKEVNIDMEPNKLRMHFAVKKLTVLYVDSNNPSNNYLDLRFLNIE